MITSAILSPFLSSRALVAMVVPMRIHSILEESIGWSLGNCRPNSCKYLKERDIHIRIICLRYIAVSKSTRKAVSARARVSLVSWKGKVIQCSLWFCSVFQVQGSCPKRYGYHLSIIINPRRACAARVTVVVSCVWGSVCMSVHTRYSGSTRD